MSDIAHSLILACTFLGTFALITFGVTSCEERGARLRSECISAGGSVIPNGSNFACVRAASVTPLNKD